MSKRLSKQLQKYATAAIAITAVLLISTLPAQARVTKIVIDEKVSPAFCKGTACASYGAAGEYEQISGRAFGELDPGNPLNKLIQDIELAQEAQ